MSRDPNPIRLVRADDGPRLDAFVELPYRLHASSPEWVPPLRRDVRALLDRRTHPFHEHAAVELLLALRGARPVGRIALIENHAHNIAHAERCAHFGFLEAEDDRDVFAALLGAARRWAARRGLDVLRGPCSPSTNEECGLLVQGFDRRPRLLMPWHPPHYQRHIEALGFAKARDLLSYDIDEQSFQQRIPDAAARIREKLARRGIDIRLRPIDFNRFDDEVTRILEVYNAAWASNWGFVPMTAAEVRRMARELRPLALPEIILFAEAGERPVGFVLGLPDYNQVLAHLGGRLGPIEALRFLRLRKSIDAVRLIGMGVVRDQRARGIEILLIAEFAASCLRHGYRHGELGWVLDDNLLMNRGIEACGGRVDKVHRIYEAATGP